MTRRYRSKQINLVKGLLDKPYWYNETLRHENWPQIKAEWEEYEKLLLEPRTLDLELRDDISISDATLKKLIYSIPRRTYHPLITGGVK